MTVLCDIGRRWLVEGKIPFKKKTLDEPLDISPDFQFNWNTELESQLKRLIDLKTRYKHEEESAMAANKRTTAPIFGQLETQINKLKLEINSLYIIKWRNDITASFTETGDKKDFTSSLTDRPLFVKAFKSEEIALTDDQYNKVSFPDLDLSQLKFTPSNFSCRKPGSDEKINIRGILTSLSKRVVYICTEPEALYGKLSYNGYDYKNNVWNVNFNQPSSFIWEQQGNLISDAATSFSAIFKKYGQPQWISSEITFGGKEIELFKQQLSSYWIEFIVTVYFNSVPVYSDVFHLQYLTSYTINLPFNIPCTLNNPTSESEVIDKTPAMLAFKIYLNCAKTMEPQLFDQKTNENYFNI